MKNPSSFDDFGGEYNRSIRIYHSYPIQLKSNTQFLASELSVKISDFGNGIKISWRAIANDAACLSTDSKEPFRALGDHRVMAPEAVFNLDWSYNADVWSAGLTVG